MHERQAGLEGRVAQVGKELAQLLGGEHALVDDRPRRERGEVQAVDGVLGALAQHEGAPLERHRVHARGGRGDEELLDARHGAERGLAEAEGLDRHDAPPDDAEPLLAGELFHHAPRLVGVVGVGGQEGEAHRVAPGLGQREARRLGRAGQEAVRHLDEDPGPVAGLDLGARRAAVGQVLEDGQRLVDDVVVGRAVQIGHHADATGVVLVSRVVEASGHRRPCPSEGNS